MSQKRQKKTYSAKEKSKMVLALLGNEKTLSEIASQYEVHPKNLQNWKAQFLENMGCVFDQGKEMKANRDTLKSHQDEIDELHRQNGKINAQLEWAKKISQGSSLSGFT